MRIPRPFGAHGGVGVACRVPHAASCLLAFCFRSGGRHRAGDANRVAQRGAVAARQGHEQVTKNCRVAASPLRKAFIR